MLGLYYRIWVDVIVRARAQPANQSNWPIGCMVFMTLSMFFNCLFIMTILERHVFKGPAYRFDFSALPRNISNVLNYLLLYALPCLTINYLLIFYNKRYERLIKKYPYYNGKLFITYFLISMWLPIALMWIGIIYSRLHS